MMELETLTIHDAELIFPLDFVHFVAAQQDGKTYIWATQDHAKMVLMETHKEEKQLKLAFASLNLFIKDGLHVLDFNDFRLKEIKNGASVNEAKCMGPASKSEVDSNPGEVKRETVELLPKRKRGRPRKTEAEKQKSRNEAKQKMDDYEMQNQIGKENTNRRYGLRGVKLSADIMNAEKGIYKAIKIKDEIAQSINDSTGNIDGENIQPKPTQTEDEIMDKGVNEIGKDHKNVQKENITVTDDGDESAGIGEGDSDDDFVPKQGMHERKNQKQGKRKTRTIPRNKLESKPKKRKTIDIGNVPKFERRKRNNEKKEECKVCTKKFCDYTGLFNHVKARHEKAQCYQSYLDELRELMVSTCEKCGAKFANRSLLHAHEDREHRQSEIVECFRCHKAFRNIMNLRSHVRAVHIMKGDKSKLCHLCPAKFKWSATLKQHLDEIHEGNKHAKCQYCDKMFYSKSQLRRHERCHGLHQSKFVVCQQCGRKFLFNHNLKRHTEIMHGSKQEVYHCSYCGRGYTTKTSMVSHVQLVHFNLFSYSCKHCSATFPRSKFLVDHMRTTHKVDNYQVMENPKERYKYRKNGESALYCSYCSESFNYKAKLVNHIHTVHADVFPHRCDGCTQGFLELSFLINHRLKAHVTTREDIRDGVMIPETVNTQTVTVIEAQNTSSVTNILEPAMTDTAAASLLVEVASGNKTYQYYIETQDPVGEDGSLTVNPEDIANVLMVAEQTIQAESGGVAEEHSSAVEQDIVVGAAQAESGTMTGEHSVSNTQDIVDVTIQADDAGMTAEHSLSNAQDIVGVTIHEEGVPVLENAQDVVNVAIQGGEGIEGVGVKQGIMIDYSQQVTQSGLVLVEPMYSSQERETIQQGDTIQGGETIIMQTRDANQELQTVVVQGTRNLEFGSSA